MWYYTDCFCVNLTQARVIRKEGASVVEMPPWDPTLRHFLTQWLVWKVPGHCGWCHPWVGSTVFYKKAGWVWMSVWWFLRKLGTNLPQDPAIPLLGIQSKDAQSYHKDMCSTMLIEALFVLARTWKQPKSPLTKKMDKQNVVYLHNGVLHSRKI